MPSRSPEHSFLEIHVLVSSGYLQSTTKLCMSAHNRRSLLRTLGAVVWEHRAGSATFLCYLQEKDLCKALLQAFFCPHFLPCLLLSSPFSSFPFLCVLGIKSRDMYMPIRFPVTKILPQPELMSTLWGHQA